MALVFFFGMAAAYLVIGLVSRRYGSGQRFWLAAVSTLVPSGILVAWLAA